MFSRWKVFTFDFPVVDVKSSFECLDRWVIDMKIDCHKLIDSDSWELKRGVALPDHLYDNLFFQLQRAILALFQKALDILEDFIDILFLAYL